MQRNNPSESPLNQIYQECRHRADQAFMADLHVKVRDHVIAELREELQAKARLDAAIEVDFKFKQLLKKCDQVKRREDALLTENQTLRENLAKQKHDGKLMLERYKRLQDKFETLVEQNKTLAAEINGKTSDGECPRLTCATTRRKLAALRAKRKTDSEPESP